jgi:hypothetical protein
MNTNLTTFFQATTQEEFYTSPNHKWRQINGRLVNISIAGNSAAGVSPDGAIYYTSNFQLGFKNWTKVKGSGFKQVVLKNMLEAYGIKRNGSIYHTPMITSGQWNRIPGWASFISVDKGNVVVIGRNNTIHTLVGQFLYQPLPGVETIFPQPGVVTKSPLPGVETIFPQPGVVTKSPQPGNPLELRNYLKTLLEKEQMIKNQIAQLVETINEMSGTSGGKDYNVVIQLKKQVEILNMELMNITKQIIDIEKILESQSIQPFTF